MLRLHLSELEKYFRVLVKTHTELNPKHNRIKFDQLVRGEYTQPVTLSGYKEKTIFYVAFLNAIAYLQSPNSECYPIDKKSHTRELHQHAIFIMLVKLFVVANPSPPSDEVCIHDCPDIALQKILDDISTRNQSGRKFMHSTLAVKMLRSMKVDTSSIVPGQANLATVEMEIAYQRALEQAVRNALSANETTHPYLERDIVQKNLQYLIIESGNKDLQERYGYSPEQISEPMVVSTETFDNNNFDSIIQDHSSTICLSDYQGQSLLSNDIFYSNLDYMEIDSLFDSIIHMASTESIEVASPSTLASNEANVCDSNLDSMDADDCLLPSLNPDQFMDSPELSMDDEWVPQGIFPTPSFPQHTNYRYEWQDDSIDFPSNDGIMAY
jgi:hypothetical protein